MMLMLFQAFDLQSDGRVGIEGLFEAEARFNYLNAMHKAERLLFHLVSFSQFLISRVESRSYER